MQTQQELEAEASELKQVYGHQTSLSNITQQQEEQEQPLQIQETHEQEASKVNSNHLQAYATVFKLKRQSQARSKVYQLFAACLLLLMIGAHELHIMGGFIGAAIVQMLIIFSAIVCFGAWMMHREAKQSIIQVDDIHLIGPLAEALDAETLTRPTAVIMALTRLLPRLQASDAAILTREQRHCLYRALTWRGNKKGVGMLSYDRDLALAILKAMEQIGDKDALPYVQYVAQWSMDHKNRAAANDCLSFLHQKTEEHRRSETYLRPSSAISTTPDILLRPASGVTATPSDELLRAGDEST